MANIAKNTETAILTDEEFITIKGKALEKLNNFKDETCFYDHSLHQEDPFIQIFDNDEIMMFAIKLEDDYWYLSMHYQGNDYIITALDNDTNCKLNELQQAYNEQ